MRSALVIVVARCVFSLCILAFAIQAHAVTPMARSQVTRNLPFIPAQHISRITEVLPIRETKVDRVFEIVLLFNAGTGTRWILEDHPNFQVSNIHERSAARSERQGETAGIPGGSREIVFDLVARERGEFILTWKLRRGLSQVFQTYRLLVRVS